MRFLLLFVLVGGFIYLAFIPPSGEAPPLQIEVQERAFVTGAEEKVGVEEDDDMVQVGVEDRDEIEEESAAVSEDTGDTNEEEQEQEAGIGTLTETGTGAETTN